MGENVQLYLISALGFIAVLALVEGLWMMWRALSIPTNLRIARRLHRLYESGVPTGESISILRGHNLSTVPALNNLMDYIPRVYVLEEFLDQAGVTMTVARFLLVQAALSVVLLAVFVILGMPIWIALVVALVAGIFIPASVVAHLREKRKARFSSQLPDTLDFLARSMQAGNPLSASFKAAAENMPEPTASEFGFTFNELNYGVNIEDALEHLGKRTGSEEMRFFIAAVLIQRTTGGNLAETLQRLAKVMRARASTHREIRIMASEMRVSANVLVALPFLVAAAVSVMSPGYLSVLLVTQFGQIIIGVQLMLMGIGYWIVHRMINFRV